MRRKTKECGLYVPVSDPPRHEACENAGRDHKKDSTPQYRTRVVHRDFPLLTGYIGERKVRLQPPAPNSGEVPIFAEEASIPQVKKPGSFASRVQFDPDSKLPDAANIANIGQKSI